VGVTAVDAGAADTGQDEAVLSERSPRIAAAHRLLRRSRRTETGEFLAEGAPAVTEAIGYAREHPGEVLELFVTEAAAAKHVRLVRAAFAAKVEVTQVSEKAAAALSDAMTPQGIVVRCAHPQTTVADVLAGSPKLVVVLVRANDPGNAGTIIRLADAAGADGVILAGDSVDAFNPKAIRASAGSLFHLPVARAADEAALLDELSAAGLSVLATTGAAQLDLDAASADGILDLPTAWLFGSEAHGLPDDVVARADEAVRVPIYGRAESLNLASAAAICLYASAGAQRRAAARLT
jgi:RNA methyltransferase, TrmH family